MSGKDWAYEKAEEILDPLVAGCRCGNIDARSAYGSIAAALRQEREASERRGAAEEFAQFAAGLRLFATKRDVFSQDLLEGIALAIDRQVQRLLAGGKR